MTADSRRTPGPAELRAIADNYEAFVIEDRRSIGSDLPYGVTETHDLALLRAWADELEAAGAADTPRAHPVTCEMCGKELDPLGYRPPPTEYEEEGWAWVEELVRLGGWRDVFHAQEALTAGEADRVLPTRAEIVKFLNQTYIFPNHTEAGRITDALHARGWLEVREET